MNTNKKHQILNDYIKEKKKKSLKTPIFLFLIFILLSSSTLGAIWFVDGIAGDWGDAHSPINNSREVNGYNGVVNFKFRTNASGIHNYSTLESYAVGNWWFERDSAKDYSGNGNDGTLVGLINTTGIVGSAYEFDGTEGIQ